MRVVVTTAVVHSVDPLKSFTEQLSAAAGVASNVTGIVSSSAAKPMSSGVMMMPQRLPAAIHAFKHTNTHVHTSVNVLHMQTSM